MEHAFNPSTREAETGDLCEFEASQVYRASSGTARATKKPCLEENKNKTNLLTVSTLKISMSKCSRSKILFSKVTKIVIFVKNVKNIS